MKETGAAAMILRRDSEVAPGILSAVTEQNSTATASVYPSKEYLDESAAVTAIKIFQRKVRRKEARQNPILVDFVHTPSVQERKTLTRERRGREKERRALPAAACTIKAVPTRFTRPSVAALTDSCRLTVESETRYTLWRSHRGSRRAAHALTSLAHLTPA